MQCQCDNCGWTGDAMQTNPAIEDYNERVDFEGEEPIGECPECRCLCYLLEE